MENFPNVPGYRFEDPTVQDFKLKQKIIFDRGVRVIRDNNVGIGNKPTDAASSKFVDLPDLMQLDPSLTYGRAQKNIVLQFLPHYVLYAGKCLKFVACFKFDDRLRKVRIIYYLEDDTICVIEPFVNNSGITQGKLVRRSKIPIEGTDRYIHWKDLNVGIDLRIYGIEYHLTSCDNFTRQFLTSHGIDVLDNQKVPDETNDNQNDNLCHYQQVNRLESIVKQEVEKDSTLNSSSSVKLIYDVIATDGGRYKIIYDTKDSSVVLCTIPDFPSNPVKFRRNRFDIYERLSPLDIIVGKTVNVSGKNFFVYDCDAATRQYYIDVLNYQQAEKTEAGADNLCPNNTRRSGLLPKAPRKDVIRQLYNFPKKLRYSIRMEAIKPEDIDRDFIMEYSLSDGTITITEKSKRNSGRIEGRFLAATAVPKPDGDLDNPRFYTPEDFHIGAKLNIFNHYFVVVDADLYVCRYIEANSDKFAVELRENILEHFARKERTKNEGTNEPVLTCNTKEP